MEISCLQAETQAGACFYNGLTFQPVGINLLKVNDRNTRARCEIYSKLRVKIPARRQ